jgi:hypothetical protein
MIIFLLRKKFDIQQSLIQLQCLLLYFYLLIQSRPRRQDSVPEFSENAGERFADGAYDYEYDPNLKLSTTDPNSNEPDGQGDGPMREDALDGTVETMTEEERAYLEEHYRYSINTEFDQILYTSISCKDISQSNLLISQCIYFFSQDMDDYDYSKLKLPEEATLGPSDDTPFDPASLKQEIVQFNCKFNLAPKESAKISVTLYLNVR